MPNKKVYEKCGFSSELEFIGYVQAQNQVGITMRDLQRKFNIGYSSFYRLTKKYGIKIITGHGYITHGFKNEEDFKEYLIREYGNGSILNIANRLNVSIETINQYFNKYNIKTRSTSQTMRLLTPKANLTDLELEVINGMLLGDGCIYIKDSRRYCPLLNYTCHHREVLDDIRFNVLKRIGWTFSINKHFDKRTNKTYVNYQISSHAYSEMVDLKNRWYVNNKKIIPKDLKLTPETCYWWYLGDGYSSNGKIGLCTNGFTIDDVKYLISQMPVECKISTQNGKPVLNIFKLEERRKFLDYVGPNRHKPYAYRWDLYDYKHRIVT